MRFFRRKSDSSEIAPDEILLDAQNLPAFETERLEGRIERPISASTFRRFRVLGALLVAVAVVQLVNLQLYGHDAFEARAEANRLAKTTVIAERGIVTDRNGFVLIDNVVGTDGTASREYALGEAAAIVLGYVSYPKKDPNGYWYQEAIEGVSGVERIFDEKLSGENGTEILETDATGEHVSGSIVRQPIPGGHIALSLDADVQKKLYDEIAERASVSGWSGGAGVIMDIDTGELVALSSYPSYRPDAMSSGVPEEYVADVLSDPRAPFLNRAVSGLYTPGSVMKPFIAVGALEHHLIDPEKQILSTGSITVPNPFDPSRPTIFRDWRAHGWTTMRRALAVSSDVYFYTIGGGYEDQEGLGIARIESVLKGFGFGEKTGVQFSAEQEGVIPNPEWKAANFDGERWFLGDTYITSIGQFGSQVTLMQLVRATASLANGGYLVTPVIESGSRGLRTRIIHDEGHLEVVRDGMRLAVTDGTAQSLLIPGVTVSAKTGTAEIGVRKEFTNSLLIGFFPSEAPRYAFAIVMERGRAGTLQGAPAVMREVFSWMALEKPELLEAR